MRQDTFSMEQYHLDLLRNSYTSWSGDEFGAPGIDPKRPYGNSDVFSDIAEIVWGDVPKWWDEDSDSFDEDMLIEDRRRLRDIHEELENALQIVLVTGKFETGYYEKESRYDSLSWVKVT